MTDEERARYDAIIQRTIGQRWRLLPPHPHAGRVGIVKSLDKTIAGYMWRIEFDDNGGPGIGGEDGCYVSNPREREDYKEPIIKRERWER